MKDKLKKLIPWVPAVVTFAAAIIVLIIILAADLEVRVTGYIGLAASGLIAGIITFLNTKFRLGMPLHIIALLCVHIVLAIDFGTTLEFYVLIGWWDLMVHGLFGLVGCIVIAYLYLKFYGTRPNAFGLVSILLMMLGVAALWELYEFVGSMVTGDDMQKVQECIDAGLSPTFDTMTDIAIAVVGAAVFYVTYFVDIKTGNKLYRLGVNK